MMKTKNGQRLNLGRKQIVTTFVCLNLGLLAAGCSPGFQSANKALNTGAQSSLLNSADEANLLETNPTPNNAAAVPTHQFSLKESGFVDGRNTLFEDTYETTIKIPYGIIYDAASAATRYAAPYACQWRGVEFEQNPGNAYARSEIPCGKIMSNGYKQVTLVDIPEQRSEGGSTMTSISPVQIPVWISRGQYSGTYKEVRLDSGTEENIQSSQIFGDDISIRFDPNGQSGKIHLCAAIPGVEVKSTPQTIKAKASYRLLGLKVSDSAKFDIDLGRATFNYVRGCFSTQVTFEQGGIVPQFKFEVTQKPVVDGVVYQGLKIRATAWWIRMLDDVLRFFRASLIDKVTKQANREVNQFIESELQTGEWFSRVHGEDVLNDLSKQLNQSLVRTFRSSGVPLSTEEMRLYLIKQCDLLPLVEDLPLSTKEVCKRAVNSVVIGFIPFHRDEVLAQKGCYDGYANIHQTRNAQGKYKEWAKDCQFAIRLQAQVKVQITDEEKEALERLWASFQNLPAWSTRIASELGLNENQRRLLLMALAEASERDERLESLNDILRVYQAYAPMVQSQFYSWLSSDLNINVPL